MIKENSLKNIRNFSIIAHIDHGKSTLSDRMLEKTKTVEERQMHDQVLDTMELEQERGITIKMQPVRMVYKYHPRGRAQKMTQNDAGVSSNEKKQNNQDFAEQNEEQEYIFNLIDTPGHIDFYYEVSRAMKAVEGAILLVDATQGVQAQTLTTLDMAKEAGLKIIPALSKCDSPIARVEEVKEEIAILLDVEMEDIIETSGKTGAGVEELFEKIIKEIPAPEIKEEEKLNALIFDFAYHENKGIIVYVRIFSGEVKKNQELLFKVANEKFKSNEVGIFTPFEKETEKLSAGEIGYIVTGIKKPGIASVGDVITTFKNSIGDEAISEYIKPKPVV
jgi:GTP-binding protein LepA